MNRFVKVKDDLSGRPKRAFAHEYRGQTVEVKPYTGPFYNGSEGFVKMTDGYAVFAPSDYDELPKFKVGDDVIVTGNNSSHWFDVGSKCKVIRDLDGVGGFCGVEGPRQTYGNPISQSVYERDLELYVEPFSFATYADKVLKHAFYPNRGSNLTYATLGLTGEAGEVANKVKKIQRDNCGVVNEGLKLELKDELGDVLWYIAACADELGLTLEDIAQYNVEKLAKRHGTNEKGEVTNSADKFPVKIENCTFATKTRVRVLGSTTYQWARGKRGLVIALERNLYAVKLDNNSGIIYLYADEFEFI